MSSELLDKPRGCSIYVHDISLVTGLRLHERYTPCGWPHVQHADEAWLSSALQHSPWRVSSPEQADLIYLDGHEFSRWCTATRILHMVNSQQRINSANVSHESACPGSTWHDPRPAWPADKLLHERARRAKRQWKPSDAFSNEPAPMMRDEKSKRRLWQLMMETSAALLAPGAARIPRVVTLTSAECPRPFAEQPGQFWGGSHTADVLLLVDHKPREFDAVTPYVVSQPDWLAGVAGSPAPPAPHWEGRKLLFIAGHTPKLTQSTTRYLLWKQLRRSQHVTALSSTIGCNVGDCHELCSWWSLIATDEHYLPPSSGGQL